MTSNGASALDVNPRMREFGVFRRDWAAAGRECAGVQNGWKVGSAPLTPCGRLPPGFSEASGNSDGLPGGLRRLAAGAVKPP